jgi:hypothetical protein
VVVSAAHRGDAILTSDPDDLRVLLVHAGAAGPVLPIQHRSFRCQSTASASLYGPASSVASASFSTLSRHHPY